MKRHPDDCCCAYCVPEWPLEAHSKEEAQRYLDTEKEQHQQDQALQLEGAGLISLSAKN